jgi:RHS repeat-associated protein
VLAAAIMLAAAAVAVPLAVGGPADPVVDQPLPDALEGAAPPGPDITEVKRQIAAADQLEPASPAEVAHSEDAHADASVTEAKNLVENEFSDTLNELDSDPAKLIDEVEIKEMLSPTAARVDYNGRPALLDSSIPIQVPDETGEPAPVDLTLDPEEDFFEPANPLVDVELPKQGTGDVVLGNGEPLRIGLSTGSDGTTQAKRLDDGLFYAEVATDTDAIVAPVSSGVELFAQIRSANAPEELTYPLELPEGAELRAGEDGAIEISRDGSPLFRILPPSAEDARGQEIPVTFQAADDDLVVRFPHRERGFLYPLLIDPLIENPVGSWNSGADLNGLVSWFDENGAAGTKWPSYTGHYALNKGCDGVFACWGNGLYVGGRKAPQTYLYDEWGQWAYRAPGATTFIQNATIGPLYYAREGDQWNRPFARYTGLYSEANGGPCCVQGHHRGDGQAAGYNGYDTPGAGWTWDAARIANAEWIVFGMTTVDGIPRPNNPNAPAQSWDSNRDRRTWYSGGASVTLEDPEAATIDALVFDDALPSGWVDHHEGSVTATVRDPGLGPKYLSLTTMRDTDPNQPVQHDIVVQTRPCTGVSYNPCANPAPATTTAWTAPPIEYDTSSFPEGETTSEVAGGDVILNSRLAPGAVNRRAFTLKIDRSAPLFNPAPSGGLASPTGSGNDLHVTLTDGAASDPRTRRSGVRTLELLVDGERGQVIANQGDPAFLSQDCLAPHGSCGMEAHFQLDMTKYEDGEHEIKLVATDQMGHERTKTWTKSFEAQPVSQVGFTDLSHRVLNWKTNQWHDREFAGLDWVHETQIQTILRANNPGDGIGGLAIAIPETPPRFIPQWFGCGDYGPQPPADRVRCPEKKGHVFQYETADFPEGIQTGSAGAWSGEQDVVASASWQFKVDHSTPSASLEVVPRLPIIGNDELPGVSLPAGGSVPELGNGFGLRVIARDGRWPGDGGSNLTDAERRSGVAMAELWVDGVVVDRVEQEEVPETCEDVGSNCPLQHVFDVDGSDYDPAITHAAKVVVTDHVGLKWSQEFSILGTGVPQEVLDLDGASRRVGLEQYFQYESQETGGQSSAHVNLDTGNLAWHKLPVVNPGRGLSTVMNLTYNSADRATNLSQLLDFVNLPGELGQSTAQVQQLLADLGLDELDATTLEALGVLPWAYDDAGNGVSVGVSGLTRINEPLGGDLLNPATPLGIFNPLQIVLRDVDGTRHVFKRDPDNPLAFDAPPGVHLHLRPYVDLEQTLRDVLELPGATLEQLLKAATLREALLDNTLRRIWAVTRPDGVTYYYNLLGYPTDIEDRNGNVMRYEYDYVQPLTGESCVDGGAGGVPPIPSIFQALDLPVPLVCQARVTKVIDSAGTEVGASQDEIEARTVALEYHPGGIVDRVLEEDGDAGKLRRVTDHADRKTTFDYDRDGNLIELVEAEGDPAERGTSLRYGGAQEPPPLEQAVCPGTDSGFSAGDSKGLYQSLIRAQSPSAYWRLGEASGSEAADSSGSGHAGSYVGSPTLGTDGALIDDDADDGAVRLDGANQHVASSYSPFANGTTRTFEGWANRESESTLDMLIGGSTPDQSAAYLTLGGEFGLPSSSVHWMPQGNLGNGAVWHNAWPTVGEWVHWALVFNESGDSAELFINGVSKGARPGITAAYAGSPGGLNAGAWRGLGGAHPYAFDGAIDEVAVYERGLTPAEVLGHYELGRARIPGLDELSGIQDPNGNWTCAYYGETGVADDLLGGARPVRALLDRRQSPIADPVERKRTRIDYAPEGEPNAAAVTDNLGHVWDYRLDTRGRLTSMTNPVLSRTELEWNSDNLVSEHVRAAGTGAESRTQYSYNDNGQLTAQREGIGSQGEEDDTLYGAGARTTVLAYRNSPGTQTSDLPGTGDGEGKFVSDLVALVKPSGARFVYELDEGASTNVGNVTAVTKPPVDGDPDVPGEPKGARNEMEYGEFGLLQVEREQYDYSDSGARLFNTTTYSDFDANGMPQTVVDPRGNDQSTPSGYPAAPSTGRWVYGYDAVGNVTQVSDPRGSVPGGPSAQPQAYKTTLTYDALDRLKHEHIPKCTGFPGGSCPAPSSSDQGNLHIDRRYEYDHNGNQTAQINEGDSARTDREFGPTDQLTFERGPVSGEVSERRYDAEDNLTELISPKGVATPGINGDFATTYKHDAASRLIAEIRQSRGPDQDLITSYAYDARDNLVGVADPRDNEGLDVNSAVAKASSPARRYSYGYNLVDELVSESENKQANPQLPGDAAQGARARFHVYDKNGNQTLTWEPRAFSTGQWGDHLYVRTFNARDELLSETNPEHERTTYAVRSDGRVTDVTSPRGNATAAIAGDFTTHYEYYPTGELRASTIPFKENQYGIRDDLGPDNDLRGLGEIIYKRDGGGNPVEITDARGNTFRNQFYDTGDLLSTERPSWWSLDWSGSPGLPDPGVHYSRRGGGGAEADLQVPLNGPRLVEAEVGGNGSGQSTDPAERSQPAGPTDFGRVEPQALPEMLPRASKTGFYYDDEMRLRIVQAQADSATENKLSAFGYDKAGRMLAKLFPHTSNSFIWHTYDYDANGNVKLYRDGRAEEWNFAYDQFDRVISENAPGASELPDGPVRREETRFSYDPNGNLTDLATPRGTVAGAGAAYNFKFIYDDLDRLGIERNPAGEQWQYRYDVADNRVAEISPRGFDPGTQATDFTTTTSYDAMNRPTRVADPLGGVTRIGYDENGNQIRIDQPGGADSADGEAQRQVTHRVFEGRDLLWKEITRGEVTGPAEDGLTGGFSGLGETRTTLTEYDPNGNLSRTVNPSGMAPLSQGDPAYREDWEPGDSEQKAGSVRDATDHFYNEDNLKTRTYLPWRPDEKDANGEIIRYKQGFKRTPIGHIRAIRAPHRPVVDQNGDEQPDPMPVPTTCYEHLHNGWISSTSDQELVDANPTDPSFNPCQGVDDQKVSYAYDEAGNQTAWKFTKADGTDAGRTVRRTYYPNGLLKRRTGIAGPESSAPPEKKTSHEYFYNPNRSLTQFRDRLGFSFLPGQEFTLQSTVIDRDRAERETIVDVRPAGAAGSDNVPDTRFTYDSEGNPLARQTDTPWNETLNNGAGGWTGTPKTTSFTYDQLGRETRAEVDPKVGTNRITTTTYFGSGPLRAREHPNGALERYFYDTDGRINRMQRRRAGATNFYKNQPYDYDLNGNRVRDERGTYDYNARDQLTHWRRGPQSDHAGTDVHYKLDGQGNIRREQDEAETEGDGSTTYSYGADCGVVDSYRLDRVTSPDGTVSDYCYDSFFNVSSITASKPGELTSTVNYAYDEFGRRKQTSGTGLPNTVYSYDALDRRAGKSTGSGPYTYVGTSELLSREGPMDAAGNGAGTSYDYSALGERLGQEKPNGTFHSYAKDVQGSVEGLEKDDGRLPKRNRYSYDPYGEMECEDLSEDCEDQLETDALRENPFRFQGFYYDAGIKTYDMQARDYRPEIGRFLNEDRYEEAGAELALQSDPLTQNRYSFAGGNPVSRIEFDGHIPGCNDRVAGEGCAGGGERPGVMEGTHQAPAGTHCEGGCSEEARRRVERAEAATSAPTRPPEIRAAAKRVARVVTEAHCGHGEWCDEETEEENRRRLYVAMLLRGDITGVELESTYSPSGSEVPWHDPFNLAVGGFSGAAATTIVRAGRAGLGALAATIRTSGSSGATALGDDVSKEALEALVAKVAQRQADKGSRALSSVLSRAERSAMRRRPFLRQAFLGTAVHRQTASELARRYPGEFVYRTKGPDFLHTPTGTRIELTTPGQVGAHRARGGEYGTCGIATYSC